MQLDCFRRSWYVYSAYKGVAGNKIPNLVGIEIDIFRYGFLGVNLFFMISGFVICKAIYQNKRLLKFAYMRFRSTYPSFFIAVHLSLLVGYVVGVRFVLWEYLLNLIFLAEYFDARWIDGVY